MLTYINLLTTGKLNEYLYEIDKQVRERFCRIVKQLKTTQGITEQMKADSPMEWVRKMNYISIFIVNIWYLIFDYNCLYSFLIINNIFK